MLFPPYFSAGPSVPAAVTTRPYPALEYLRCSHHSASLPGSCQKVSGGAVRDFVSNSASRVCVVLTSLQYTLDQSKLISLGLLGPAPRRDVKSREILKTALSSTRQSVHNGLSLQSLQAEAGLGLVLAVHCTFLSMDSSLAITKNYNSEFELFSIAFSTG